MKEENEEKNTIFILYRIIFFIALFIISVGMFKVVVIDDVVMILLLFIMMICSSIFNISTRKKSNSVVGRILLLIVLLLIIVLNFILYYKGFYEFSIVEDLSDDISNVPRIPKRYDSYLTDIIFFIGETITFFSILVEVFLELIEKEHILRVVNTCIFVLFITVFSCILPGILVVPNLLLYTMLSIGAFLSVILLFIRRNSKPIKMLEVMILFMIFIIVCLRIYGIIADYYFMISC